MESKTYCADVDGEIALMVGHDLAPCGKVFAFIIPSCQASRQYQGDVTAFAAKAVECLEAAIEWFGGMSVNRPWETRH